MSSTDSQPAETPPTESSAEKTLREAMQQTAGIKRLGMMAGVKSLVRNLQYEDDAVRRDTDAHHRSLWGDTPAGVPSEEDEMEIMVAGNLTIQNGLPASQPAAQSAVQPIAQPAAQQSPASSAGSTLAKAAIAAGLVATGGLGGVAASALLAPDTPQPPAVVSPAGPDTDTKYGLEVSADPPPQER